MILGAGPSLDIEAYRGFVGIKIVTDKMYHKTVEENIYSDYAVTLEDSNLSHYFSKPHLKNKPTIITSIRTPDVTLLALGGEDFNLKIFPYPIMQVTYNVGLMSYIYAVFQLKCKEVELNGFDHLYPVQKYNSFDLKHLMWREMFWDVYEDWVPKDVKTTFTGGHKVDFLIQHKKDMIQVHTAEYPGFDDMDNYIRYRRDRNDRYVRKLNEWGDENH